MTKKEFVELYAKKGDLTKKNAETYINLFLSSVEEVLVNGDSIGFVGWGKWEVKHKNARKVKNPKTKKLMTIEERKVVKFKTGKLLAEKVR